MAGKEAGFGRSVSVFRNNNASSQRLPSKLPPPFEVAKCSGCRLPSPASDRGASRAWSSDRLPGLPQRFAVPEAAQGGETPVR